MPMITAMLPSSANAPLATSNIASRKRRYDRLSRNLRALITLCPDVHLVENTPRLEDLLRQFGFRPFDVAVEALRMGCRAVTLVCAPYLTWHRDGPQLMALKRAAADQGQRVVLIPESAVQRQPRLNTALAIADAVGTHIPPTARMQILAHIVENGGSASINDCANAVTHPDPVAAIFQMISDGVLAVDLSRALLPHSVVSLATPSD